MLAAVRSCVLRGLEGRMVEVQVDVAPGKVGFFLVGLASTSVKEARERVRAAIRNSGHAFPSTRRLTVNLAPAELRKESPGLDLAIAVAICLAAESRAAPADAAFVGELALDGAVRHVDGMLVAALSLRAAGVRRLFLPGEDAAEAALVEGLEVHPCSTLAEAVAFAGGQPAPVRAPWRPEPPAGEDLPVADDLCDVHGQDEARRALEVAAAGGHHLLMTGPPGAGKTMLARCLPGILPPLEFEEALELAQIRSLVGELPAQSPLSWQRPFRSPHHNVTTAGLLGGGSGVAMPGEISKAHHGVLFLDELAEFQPAALQALRQPLEQGSVSLTRAGGSVTYPARFLLVAASNPCPCGWAQDRSRRCRCSPAAIAAHQRGLSGPILDRIDLQVGVAAARLEALTGEARGEASAAVRRRVVAARRLQLRRQGCLNSQLRAAELRALAPLPPGGRRAFERWATEQGLTARGLHRAWRVARTVADLEGAAGVDEHHVLEALGYRLGEAAA